MNRRRFLLGASALTLTPVAYKGLLAQGAEENRVHSVDQGVDKSIQKIQKSPQEWHKALSDKEFHILRQEGTEPRDASPLLHEERAGMYVCAGCALPLFKSDWKYHSGTGWPSFYTVMHEHIETKRDFKAILPRTEYHCARCGGHQGHRFRDGPRPTGERWCNNGAALHFKPA